MVKLGEFLKLLRPTVASDNSDIMVTINVDTYYRDSKKYFSCKTYIDEEKLIDVQSILAEDPREVNSIEIVNPPLDNLHVYIDITEWIDCAEDFFRE